MPEQTIGIGVLGCGAFGRFALSHITEMPEVELVGIGATYPDAADLATEQFGVPDLGSAEDLVERPEVDLVYIATPPFLHHQQSMLALEAGKHVLCEKPLALSLPQADEMMAAAGERDLLLAANLVQRYNPLYEPVRTIIEEKLLGEPLHAYFENYAKDEPLSPNHWFWDRDKSGGIFVEHGVHFFDMFHGWLGEGRVEAAQRCIRPGTEIEEQVQCTVRYGEDVLVNFYHGFHQPERLDRQELRLVFERGDVTLHGWIPIGASVEAIVDRETRARFQEIFPDATMGVLDSYEGEQRQCTGRHKDMTVDEEIRLMTPEGIDKEQRYGDMVKAMVEDQVAWIRDRAHERKITAQNGRQSLKLALEADRLAR